MQSERNLKNSFVCEWLQSIKYNKNKRAGTSNCNNLTTTTFTKTCTFDNTRKIKKLICMLIQ